MQGNHTSLNVRSRNTYNITPTLVLSLCTILAYILVAMKWFVVNMSLCFQSIDFILLPFRIGMLKQNHTSRKLKITQDILKLSAEPLFNYTIVTGNESHCSKCRLVWRTRHLQADNITGERYRNVGWNERDLNRYAKQGLIVIYTCMESTHTKLDIANR